MSMYLNEKQKHITNIFRFSFISKY